MVYISSFKVSTLDYVDKDSMGHGCVTSRQGENIYAEFKHLPEGSWDRYLSENQEKVVDAVNEFCEENGLECEIVDIESLSFLSKMKLMFKGIKAPTIMFGGKTIQGVPTKEELKTLNSK